MKKDLLKQLKVLQGLRNIFEAVYSDLGTLFNPGFSLYLIV